MQDEIKRLTKYLDQLKQRQSDPTPSKHINRVQQYQQFLAFEVKATKAKLDVLKLGEK